MRPQRSPGVSWLRRASLHPSIRPAGTYTRPHSTTTQQFALNGALLHINCTSLPFMTILTDIDRYRWSYIGSSFCRGSHFHAKYTSMKPQELAKRLHIADVTLRRWAREEYADFLSPSARAATNSARRAFTDQDSRILAWVALLRDSNTPHAEIIATLRATQADNWRNLPPFPSTSNDEIAVVPREAVEERVRALQERFSLELQAAQKERNALERELRSIERERDLVQAQIAELKAENAELHQRLAALTERILTLLEQQIARNNPHP
jgi:DNA-binding transcriptional MerR regulator